MITNEPNASPPAVLIAVKVVPGARSDALAGVLGDRLKIRVSAPPEGGRANRAVCELIARALGLRANAVTVATGMTNPEKVIRAVGVDADRARTLLLGEPGSTAARDS
ncbi:MAG: DUF167 domain-containing protein [Phycisphaerales bacterium]|jgi:uncharacterized protein (TIGR00251 family)|nr:DUF167 domain-containing protein [Phycisphaerales bacterium]